MTRKRKILNVIAVFLSLAFVSSFFIYSDEILRWLPIPNQTNQNTILVDCSNSIDWNTYRNDKYGFEFKYPKYFYSYMSGNVEIFSTFPREKFEKYYGTTERIKVGNNYGLIEIIYPTKSLSDLLKLRKQVVDKLSSLEEIEKVVFADLYFNEYRSYKIYYQKKHPDFYTKSINIEYLIPYKDALSIISFQGMFEGQNGGEYEKYASDFEQMIRCLKFIDNMRHGAFEHIR